MRIYVRLRVTVKNKLRSPKLYQTHTTHTYSNLLIYNKNRYRYIYYY